MITGTDPAFLIKGEANSEISLLDLKLFERGKFFVVPKMS